MRYVSLPVSVVGVLLITAGCGVESETTAKPRGAERLGARSAALTVAQANLSQWTPPMPVGQVPVSGANLPDGKVLLWSADDRFTNGTGIGRTYSVVFDPQTSALSERLVSETNHSMFCPGTALLSDGQLLVSGGESAPRTSLFNPATGAWTSEPDMNIARGYAASVPLPNGTALILGGSWSGGTGNKHGEIWRASSGWRVMPGIPIGPFTSVDTTRDFGQDSQLWLLPVGNGRVFHAGPGVAMHFIDTEGDGKVVAAGPRGDDEFSINGTVVMIDAGKVLKMGGQPGYDGVPANANTYLIDVATTASVRKLAPMAYQRSFQNSVVLPNGQVVVVGGATLGISFSDDNAVLVPEIFDPITESFTALPPIAQPRNYHSIGLLLPDGRVLSGGGGLCGGCSADHPDIQLLSPPYLFNADGSLATRPVITSAPSTANHGTTMTVTTNSAVASFAIVRLSATTHAVNNDQRRLSLTFQETGPGSYSVQVPSNPGWALPGNYMLFALNAQGTPSIARTIRIGAASQLLLRSVDNQIGHEGTGASLQLELALPGAGNQVFSAQGLPAGLSIDPSTGLIQGVPTTPGSQLVEVSVSDGVQTVSNSFGWKIIASGDFGNGTAQFVKLEAVTEWNGQNIASAAELNLLDASGSALSRNGWTVVADTAQLPEYGADRAIDGNANSFWHTQFASAAPMPHSLQLDLGAPTALTGLRYLPRQDGSNGSIRQYRVYLSYNGVHWGSPVSSGDFSTLGSVSDEKTVLFGGGSPSENHPPTLQQPVVSALTVGVPSSLSLQATDPDTDVLSFSASGLPAGLNLASGTGVITGTPTTAAAYDVIASVSDGRGGSASTQFTWVVGPAVPPDPGTPNGARYVMLRALSEINGSVFASGAELNLLGSTGQILPRTGWTATADSFEAGYGPGNLLDGNNGSLWHTRWTANVPYPHWVRLDLGATTALTGLKYGPRSGETNGTIADFEVYLSNDGVNWGSPVASGDFADMGPTSAEKTVTFSAENPPSPTNNAPTLQQPSVSALTVGVATSLSLQASDPDNDPLTFAATSLPAGLSLNPATGVIDGAPTTAGSYDVNLSVNDGRGGVGTAMLTWLVNAAPAGPSTPGSARYVLLRALSEINGSSFASGAELNLLGSAGQTLPRTNWTATADSFETGYGPGNLLDGNNGSLWHTRWTANVPYPHWVRLDLGTTTALTGLKYRPRTDNPNGIIGDFEVYLSGDGVDWGSPVASGDFADMGPASAEKTVAFSIVVPPTPLNHAPTLEQPTPTPLLTGTPATLTLHASDPDGDSLLFSATGLPPGLTLAPATGVISGTPTSAGVYDVDLSVSDGHGGVGTAQLTWGVADPPPVVSSVVAPVVAQGTAASYSASASGAGPLQYSWDFGDGSAATPFSTAATISHIFASPGVYNGTLTVQTVGGAASSTQFLQGVSGPALSGSPKASSSLALEPRAGQSSRLWIANIDNDSVSVFDTLSYAKLQEIAVGSRPRALSVGPGGKVWVTNKGSATLSVIDTTTFAVTTLPLPRASAPYGVVARSADLAYVALEATGQLLAVNAAGVVLSSIDVGANPRHLALSADASKLLVTRFVSPFQAGESTASVHTVVGGVAQGGEVRVLDTASMTVSKTITLQFSTKPDTTVGGRGLPNYLGAPAISPDGASAWIPSKQDNIQRGTLRDGLPLTFENTVRAVSSRLDLAALAEDYAARLDHDNSGVASAAAYHPNGVYLFVALEAGRQVAIVDAARKRELLRVNTGRAPQALSVSLDGSKLFVNNALDRNVSVFDLSPLVTRGEGLLPVAATLSSVQTEALAANVLRGKQLFYDARDTRLARDAYLSCATCHNDGESDGRTWDFTSLGEGLRNTVSLRGRGGSHGPLHWSANFDEVQDFEGQIRTLSQGTGLMSDAELAVGTRLSPLGTPKLGVSADLDALAAYVASLDSFASSPYRLASGDQTSAATLGAIVFADECSSCHGGPGFSDSPSSLLHDIGTITPSSGQRLGGSLLGIDTPTLRDVWATAPYLHDGSAGTLEAAIAAHADTAVEPADLLPLVEYVRQIGSEEPGFAP
jgi:YVTN family beta-propeller protein